MEFDYSKLRGRIVEKFGSISNFSDHLKKSRQSTVLKLSNKINFTRDDIIEWSMLLDIPQEDYGLYFFTEKLNKL